ncbi:hypothetical protein QR680_014526 [Steinernema hermaphroditum]|uniref:Uncharacterized protein n=1 Tax=Steinernema hermaphroditum TaxID=289476 RepID=A0AA39IBC3_9BILA|nr:hypothetical protein QR680_014526 [Steinernema hermaphroditum]
MEIYFNKAEYDRLYRCDYLNESQWREYVVQRPNTGLLVLGLGIVYFITYVPCLMVMCRKQFFENSCFKIMFFNGLFDIMTIIMTGFITGYLLITGTVFCLNPTVQYIAGILGVAGWCGQCLNCTILAINRCLDFWSPRLSMMLFEGSRTFFWWAVVVIYATYFTIFTKPLTLSSDIIMWLYDPYVGVPQDVVPVERSVYNNFPNYYNNFILIPALFVLYTFLIISIRLKTTGGNSQLKTQLHLLKQAGLICLLNFIPGFLFICDLFLPTPPIFIFITLVTWQLGNGGGGLILVIVNKTIREQIVAMVFNARLRGGSVGPGIPSMVTNSKITCSKCSCSA